MRIDELLTELRKNPEQNPKVSINDTIIDTYDDVRHAKEFAGDTDCYNMFVSMTAVDKLGINPKSKYDTPLGIYAYPGEFVRYKVGANNNLSKLPFAGDQPFVNIFKAKGNIIGLPNMTAMQYGDLLRKLLPVWTKQSKLKPKDAQAAFNEMILAARTEANVDSFGGWFWYVTFQMSDRISDVTGGAREVIWNKLFRDIGVDGCVDYDSTSEVGAGIIHVNEPTQAVFFSIGAITGVKRYDNKYSGNTMKTSRAMGNDNKRYSMEYNAMDDAEFIELMKQYPNVVRFRRRPSEEIQMYLALNAPESLRHIRYVSEPVQYKIVTNDPFSLEYINNPTDAVKIYAMKLVAKQGYKPPSLFSLDRFVANDIQPLSPAVKQAAMELGWVPN